MKRFLSICVLCTMLFSMVACDKKIEGGDSSKTPTLIWYVPGDKQPDINSVLQEANKIIQSKIEAKLDLRFIDAGAFQEKMNIMMASGDKFDLCFSGYLNNYKRAAERGGILDITDMIEQYAPDLKTNVRDYAFKSAEVKGRIYGVPNMQIIATSWGLCVQKKYADKYGFDPEAINTIGDIEPLLEKIKQNEQGVYPYRSSQGLHVFNLPKFKGFGGTVATTRRDDPDMKIINGLEQPEQLQGAKKLREWYVKGYIREDALSAGNDDQDYRAGKYAVVTALMKPGVEAEMKNDTGVEWVSAKFKAIPTILGSACNTMIAIGKNSQNKTKSLQFIDLINKDKDLFNLLCFGIQDKHYTVNKNNKVELITGSGYTPNASWKFGNQFNAKIMEGQENDIWEKTIALNDSAEKNLFDGFQVDKSNIKTEISQVETITKQYAVINFGAEEPENYWDTYIKKLKEAGIDKIFQVEKQQAEEFLANLNK